MGTVRPCVENCRNKMLVNHILSTDFIGNCSIILAVNKKDAFYLFCLTVFLFIFNIKTAFGYTN